MEVGGFSITREILEQRTIYFTKQLELHFHINVAELMGVQYILTFSNGGGVVCRKDEENIVFSPSVVNNYDQGYLGDIHP